MSTKREDIWDTVTMMWVLALVIANISLVALRVRKHEGASQGETVKRDTIVVRDTVVRVKRLVIEEEDR